MAPEKACMVQVYLTRDESERIGKRARALGMSKSAYVRSRTFAPANSVSVDPQAVYELADVVGELGRMTGELLRQARDGHDPSLMEITQAWRELVDAVHCLKTGRKPPWLT